MNGLHFLRSKCVLKLDLVLREPLVISAI